MLVYPSISSSLLALPKADDLIFVLILFNQVKSNNVDFAELFSTGQCRVSTGDFQSQIIKKTC